MAGVPVVAALTTASAPVHINVGGSPYISTLETLTKFPQSKLAKMFNGTIPMTVDPITKSFFLDRDGKTFRHVLNYLRNSKLVLPNNFTDFELLLEEAKFFQLEDLCMAVEEKCSESEESSDEDNRGQQTDNKPRRGKRTHDKSSETCTEKLETHLEKMTGLMESAKETFESQIGKLTEVMNVSVKSTAAANVHTSTDQSNQSINTMAGEVRMLSQTIAKLMSPRDTATNLPQSEQSCSDIVYVQTFQREVAQIWCSDEQLVNNFQTSHPVLPPSYLFNVTKDRNRNNEQYLRISKSSNTMGFITLALYLFKNNYKLVSTCGGGGGGCPVFFLHCFVK